METFHTPIPLGTVTRETATLIEAAEVRAWLDMYEAVPADFAERYGIRVERLSSLSVFLCRGIPFRHFNAVYELGLAEPATESSVDEILGVFAREGIDAFYIHHTPLGRPAELPRWLEARGLRVLSRWDRIHRDAAPLPPLPPEEEDLRVERVSRETAAEWAAFLDGMYRMPTTQWLLALVGRRGWYHYVLRRGTSVVAARSMYLGPDCTAWLGIDAPVPGIMTQSYHLDARLCRAIVEDGLWLGATAFVGDIEAPSPAMDTPAYRDFGSLGFRMVYSRSNYGR